MRRRGEPSFEVEHAVWMATYFAAGADGIVTDAVLRLTGHQARTIDAFLSATSG